MLKSEDANITLLSAEDFIRSYKPPKFIIKNVLQSGYLTTVTAKIGGGKTALLTYMAFCVALGHNFGSHKTSKGKVIYVAAENDQDVIQRFAAQAQAFGLSELPKNLDVIIVGKSHDFLSSMEQMPIECYPEDVDLIIIDTATAIYNGSDENDNVQQKEFASKIRKLVELIPGNPAIVIACHPPKNTPHKSALLPRGGSALYGEIDCGIIAVKAKALITIEATEKFRGESFDPITLKVIKVACERIKDSDGTPIKSIAILPDVVESSDAKPIAEEVIYSNPPLVEAILKAIKKLKSAKRAEILKALVHADPSKAEINTNILIKAFNTTIHEMRDSSLIICVGKTYSLPSENK